MVHAHINLDNAIDEVGRHLARLTALGQLQVAAQHFLQQDAYFHARKERPEAKVRSAATK